MCVHDQVIYPHLPETNHTCIPLVYRRYVYPWYLQHECKLWAEAQQVQAYLTKHAQYIQQVCNTSYDDHVIVHEWNAHWMQFLIHLFMFMSRLLLSYYLDSGLDVHTLLCATIEGCWGERSQHSTGPLTKTFHMLPLHKIMSEEGMYDTPRLILIVVSLIHVYGLLVGISLIIKLMHVHVETYLTVIFLHARTVL